MLRVEGLSKTFYSGIWRRKPHKVLDHVSFVINSGETLGLIGDSGCGKTTIARCILKLIPADSGEVFLGGDSVFEAEGQELSCLRRRMQMIFQHPYSALNPRQTVFQSLAEGMAIHRLWKKEKRRDIILELLDRVELHSEILNRYPHQVSGGQLQRIVIARALSLNPEFLILDEPTSMLDISVQASILHLLKNLQSEHNLTYLFISHDKDVVQFMSHDVRTME